MGIPHSHMSDSSDELPSPSDAAPVPVVRPRRRATRPRRFLDPNPIPNPNPNPSASGGSSSISISSSSSSSIHSVSSEEEAVGLVVNSSSNSEEGRSRDEDIDVENDSDVESDDSSVVRMRIVNSIFPEVSSSSSSSDSSDPDTETEPEPEPEITEMAPTTRSSTGRGRGRRAASAATGAATPSSRRPNIAIRGRPLGRGRGGQGQSRGRRTSSASTISISSSPAPVIAPAILARMQELASPRSRRATTAPAAPSAASQPLDLGGSSGNFECVVCLETLDCPATVLPVEAPAQAPSISASSTRRVINIRGAAPLVVNAAAAIASSSAAGAANAVHQTPSAIRAARELATIDPREIVVTTCGHMYHRYCVQKWFNEQGRKTCPNCRKSVGKGLLKLYPNFSQEPGADGGIGGTRGRRHSLGQGPATVTVAGGVTPGGRRAAANSNCQNPGCSDLVQIHATLINDYNELRERYDRTKDDLEMRNGELASLTDSYERTQEELGKIAGAKRTRRN